MGKDTLRGSMHFKDPGRNQLKIIRIDSTLIRLSIQNNIEEKAGITIDKNEALRIAAKIISKFNFDEED